jgi:pimeloyl-ACP methyl ester carboxylesterase
VRLTSAKDATARRLVLRLLPFAVVVLSACFSTAHAANPTSYFVKGPTVNQKKIVIFVHGVLGDSRSTWTNPNGAYWPRLIADDPDFQQYDVYAYGYLSPFIKEASTINEIATRMAQQLKDRHIFQHYDQIFFIAHSAGGLVTKRMLDTLNTPAQVRLLKKVRCVLYISVPSNGSELAGLASWLSSNPQFKSLSPPNAADFLQSVEADWDQILRERTPSSPFPTTFSAYEKLSTKGLMVVPALYYTQSDGPVLSFDESHSDIVKPQDRSSDIYEWARSRILDASALIPATPASNQPHARSQTPRDGEINIEQHTTGDCSPNIIGPNNSVNCGPLPPPPPTIKTCASDSKLEDGLYSTVISFTTNVQVFQPGFLMSFDKPVKLVDYGGVRMGFHALGMNAGVRLDTIPNPDNSVGFRIISIDMSRSSWEPADGPITATVTSKSPVTLLKVEGGRGEGNIVHVDTIVLQCDK